jgi:hypothetical protein
MILSQDYIRLNQVVSSQPGRYVIYFFIVRIMTRSQERRKGGRKVDGREKEEGRRRRKKEGKKELTTGMRNRSIIKDCPRIPREIIHGRSRSSRDYQVDC